MSHTPTTPRALSNIFEYPEYSSPAKQQPIRGGKDMKQKVHRMDPDSRIRRPMVPGQGLAPTSLEHLFTRATAPAFPQEPIRPPAFSPSVPASPGRMEECKMVEDPKEVPAVVERLETRMSDLMDRIATKERMLSHVKGMIARPPAPTFALNDAYTHQYRELKARVDELNGMLPGMTPPQFKAILHNRRIVLEEMAAFLRATVPISDMEKAYALVDRLLVEIINMHTRLNSMQLEDGGLEAYLLLLANHL